MNSYLPDYLKPELLELQIQLPPRHHTQVNHTYLSLSSSPNQTPCRPPLGLIPRQGEKAPPSTCQVPGRRHSSLPSSSPPHIRSVSLLCCFDSSICLLQFHRFSCHCFSWGRGSSPFSRTTASQLLYLPLVMFPSKPSSTSFQYGPSGVWLWPCHPLVRDLLRLPHCLK